MDLAGEAKQEVEPGHAREEVGDQVIVRHVVAIQLQAFHVVRSDLYKIQTKDYIQIQGWEAVVTSNHLMPALDG